MIWQNKRLLKTQKVWQKPSWLSNQPKGLSKEDWEHQVRDWKIDKLTVLDKLQKKKSNFSKNEE